MRNYALKISKPIQSVLGAIKLKVKILRMIMLAYVKKLLGIRSPSALWHGYEFEYDWLKARRNECK